MVSKKDPICGMPGTIKKYNHYFCSQQCIQLYEKKKGITTKKSSKAPIIIISTLLAIILMWVLQTTGYMIHFMGIFFILVSLLKLADWKGFANAFVMYDIIAKKSKGYAYIYPLIELGLGISFILFWNVMIAAVITFIIMGVGTIGVAQNLLSKSPVRCACLGTLIKIPLTKFTLVEDILMAIMALMVLFL